MSFGFADHGRVTQTTPPESLPEAPVAKRRGLSRDPLLAAVAIGLGGEALADVRTRIVHRADVLVGAHETPSTVYAVLSGRLGVFARVAADRADGSPRLRLREILGPGQRAGMAEVLSGSPSSPAVAALSSGVVAVISAASLRQWCTHPDIALSVLRDLARQTATQERRRVSWGQLDVSARMAALVLELHDAFGSIRADAGRSIAVIPHGLSQTHLGDLIGARRETVNRVVRGLEAEGLLRAAPRALTVYDLPALARRAGGETGPADTVRRAVS